MKASISKVQANQSDQFDKLTEKVKQIDRDTIKLTDDSKASRKRVDDELARHDLELRANIQFYSEGDEMLPKMKLAHYFKALLWQQKAHDFVEKLNVRAIEMEWKLLSKIEETAVIVPGCIYTQLPFQQAPAELWAWIEWEQVTDIYAGHFFRAEGINSMPFKFEQHDAFQGHSHHFWVNGKYAVAGRNMFTYGQQTKGSDEVIREPESDDTNGEARVANETRPANYAVRIWKSVGYSLT